ncbi:hypothetical protein U0039_10090 [Stenotrophomonas maltophilia]|uniref:hypothetical protein n=1 Tax=Stenotrophomonas maltophilia TaxID=40324 RepID=UPI00046AF9F3|nr:hypothetical protein [Stenotrophomonas maltophilia]OMP41115.1 hypothetical protein BMR86_03375 [Stenotrophomonas sp. KAs 5-3]AIL06230.1 hypothetical protein DP16_1965 [Stenotrophomonas maltophilia]OOD14767.1 hypothetical protein BWP19_10555 [Stenotrophomonas maltophilia]QQA84453.1 hypothetical protein I6I01_08690 [Stenotrophomonas maltophilia]WQE25673.1 hypothetical protein U0039_10090 [Stenotrophomonas maltophilia]
MAKQKNTSAQATSGPADAREAPAAVVDAAAGQGEQTDAESHDADAADAVSEPETDEGGDSQRPETVEADNDLPPSDEVPAPPEGETVPALVLSNNHLGKVGQVIQVNAAHVEALRLGGLIDPHPNAIKSATPEE